MLGKTRIEINEMFSNETERKKKCEFTRTTDRTRCIRPNDEMNIKIKCTMYIRHSSIISMLCACGFGNGVSVRIFYVISFELCTYNEHLKLSLIRAEI